ncbi:MAG TPA: hypothetical protein DC006_04680 [Prevotellaceae bacterium]|nr:hypothetical protein [Prevotellaceae bacterium]HBE54825.1 hypothetical protein [Prevotellaceae bacterium]
MKKIFTLTATAAFVMCSSCGGNTDGKVAVEDSLAIDTVATLEEDTSMDLRAELGETLQSGDSAQVNAAIEQATQEAQRLLESGDQAGAEKYAGQIKAFVDANTDKLKELGVSTMMVNSLLETVKDLPANAGRAARETGNAVKAATNAAKAEAGEAATKAKADAKAAADQAVEDAKEKAKARVDEAAGKASEKVDQAVEDAADRAKKKLGI